jgi:hypothetical protein
MISISPLEPIGMSTVCWKTRSPKITNICCQSKTRACWLLMISVSENFLAESEWIFCVFYKIAFVPVLVQLCFIIKNGQRRYKYLVLGRDKCYFVKNTKNSLWFCQKVLWNWYHQQSTSESVLKFPPLKLSRSRGHTKFLLIVNILIIEIVSQTRCFVM